MKPSIPNTGHRPRLGRGLNSRRSVPTLSPARQCRGIGRNAGLVERSMALFRSGPILLSFAGVCSALLGWMIFEPFFRDGGGHGIIGPANAFMFPAVFGLMCAVLGSVENRWLRRRCGTLTQGLATFGIAFAVTAVLLFPSRLIFLWFEATTISAECATGVRDLLPVMIGRSFSWGLLGLGAGLAMACANPRGRIAVARITGGLTAGLIAGILFDPIQTLAASPAGEAAWISRCSGFVVIGGLSGLFAGVAKEANGSGAVLVISGESIGERMLLGSRPGCIGSSPECDIVIQGSGSIMPIHAVVQKNGIGFEIECLSREARSIVNGKTINRVGLAHGDRIRIGDADLLFTRPYEVA